MAIGRVRPTFARRAGRKRQFADSLRINCFNLSNLGKRLQLATCTGHWALEPALKDQPSIYSALYPRWQDSELGFQLFYMSVEPNPTRMIWILLPSALAVIFWTYTYVSEYFVAPKHICRIHRFCRHAYTSLSILVPGTLVTWTSNDAICFFAPPRTRTCASRLRSPSGS